MSWLVDDKANKTACAALQAALKTEKALALVGAGSSVRVGYPSWGGLLERMAEKIIELTPLAKPQVDALVHENDVLWRAEKYRDLLGINAYAELIRATFGPENASCDEFHQDLVRLPFRHILTTNYDAVLEQAHARTFAPSSAIAVRWTEQSDMRELINRIGDAAYGRRYVYMHGRFNDPDNIVLTEGDFTERFVTASDTWPKLFSLLAAQRVVSVGFSLSDVDVMGVFRSVKTLMGRGEPRHFAFLPSDEKADAGTTRMRLRSKYGVEPVFYRWSLDHQGLPALIRQMLVDLKPRSLPPPAPSNPGGPDPLPVPMGYDPYCYVPRRTQEQVVLTGLSNAGSPVVLLGPVRFGKTAMLKRILDTACAADAENGEQSRSVLIELDTFGEKELLSEEDFLLEIAVRLVQGVDGLDIWVDEAWDRPGMAGTRLTWLLENHILKTVTGRLILAIESADELSRVGFSGTVLALLRSWAQEHNGPWNRLRTALAVSTQSFNISGSSFFNAAMLVQLLDFDDAQILALQKLYRLPWDAEDRTTLTSEVGGHPFLLRLAMFECAVRGVPVSTVVAESIGDGGIFRRHLDYLRAHLTSSQLKAIARVLDSGTAALDAETEEHLVGAGILRGSAGSYQLRYPLYARYFRRQCPPQ